MNGERGSSVLLLVPDLHGPPGGIAAFCRMAERALRETEWRTTAVALHDDLVNAPPREDYIACGGSRIRFVLRALRVLASRPDVVLAGHAHFAALGWFLARLSGARFVVFLYGIESWHRLSPVRRWALRRADVCIAISEFTRHRACTANGLAPDRVDVVYPALDPLPAATSGKGPPSLLTVGRVSASEGYKGHDRVIRVLPALLARFPELVLEIVGDGDGLPALRRLAGELGVAGSVRFHGRLSDAMREHLYSRSSIFVMPSSGEGFGLVFLEAMAHGLPVVAGNGDATPEVVAHGETGLLVNPESVDAVKSALMTLLTDEDLRMRLGSAGRERLAARFTFQRFRDDLDMAMRRDTIPAVVHEELA